jgi:hypothetical protein
MIIKIIKRLFCTFVFLFKIDMEEPIDKFSGESINELPQKPTQILKFLCILTFIWSGLGIFQNLTYTLFFEEIKELIKITKLPADYEAVKQGVEELLRGGRWFFFSGRILNISSVYGAILMLKMKKQGFHFYAIAQIIMLMLPMIYIKGMSFSGFNFFITSSFIAMYAIQIKAFEIKK